MTGMTGMTAMTTAAPLVPSCTCFSLCNSQNATSFLNAIPDIVDDVQSPWVSYLSVIYGTNFLLPFELKRLEFFYSMGTRWQNMSVHLDAVSWPMAQCAGSHALPSASCSAAECGIWTKNHESNRIPIFEKEVGVQVLFEHGVSVGTIVRWRRTHWHPRPNHTNVEIFRTSGHPGISLAPYESCTCDRSGGPAYGCWFLKAVGTGMYINLQNTLVLPYKRAGIDFLAGRYKNDTGTAAPEARSKTLRSLFDRHISFISGHFGHDTIQVRYDELPHPVSEVVVTSRYACATNPELKYELYRRTPCVPIPVHLSKGGMCNCQRKSVLLNCEWR